MIIPIALLFGALGYLFYTSKKKLLLDHHASLEKPNDNDELFKELEDLFI